MIHTDITKNTVTILAKRNDGSTQRFAFETDGGVFVGRSVNCGLRLQGDYLSEIHCRIEVEDGDAWVQDWMSKQGTMVDGVMIETKTLLEPGAVLNIGEYAITIDYAAPSHLTLLDATSTGTSTQSLTTSSGNKVASSGAQELPSLSFIKQPAGIGPIAPDEAMSFDFEADFFEEETFDRETVELLQAEIADLRAALVQRDALLAAHSELHPSQANSCDHDHEPDQSDALLSRMQDLLDEAQRSDERVELLEQMLHTSELATRSEHEERAQLEGWVGEIERRIGQREDEHAAEIQALQERLKEALTQRDQIQKKLHVTASYGAAPQHYEETIDELQRRNRDLVAQLDVAARENALLTRKIAEADAEQNEALREERALIAQERAKLSRLRYELSNRLNGLEQLPKSTNDADRETALRLRTLRQHLREIHEEEKREAQESSLTTRVKKLWKRVEY